MTLIPVDLMSVLVAAIVSMVLGAIWYSPGVFGKKWMSYTGIKQADMKSGAGKAYALGFLFSLLTAFVMAQFVELTGSLTAGAGAMLGFWAWLGFVLTVTVGDIIWGKGNKNLFYLNNGFNLVNYIVMGAILGGWPY